MTREDFAGWKDVTRREQNHEEMEKHHRIMFDANMK
jgi:hypothetical protein